jgi:serine/threonine-protein kinase NIM1
MGAHKKLLSCFFLLLTPIALEFLVVETLGRVHLITEYIPGGELYYKIVQNGIYTEDKAAIMFKQVSMAVQHMVS